MRPKLELREKARELRSKGWSYSEICAVVPVTKSSISLWCRDVNIGKSYKRRLINMALAGAVRGRKKWADLRRAHKAETLKKFAIEAKQEIGRLSRRDRFIAGLMLYAGEGDKSGERIGVSNGNPKILQFMLEWFIEFLELDRDRFTVHLYLHAGRSEKKARAFWVKVLRISNSQITYLYRPEPRPSHKGNVYEFGVCAIRFHNKMAHRRLAAWIRAALNDTN